VGSIYGEEVSPNEFRDVLNQVSQQNPDANQNQQNNSAWNRIIQERIIASVSKNIGLNVTEKEIYELETGSINEINRHSVFTSFFTNQETQAFDISLSDNFISDFANQREDYKSYFMQMESGVTKDRYTQKYQSLVEKGMYTTNSEMINTLNSRIQNATVQYVSVPFSTEAVDVSEEEIIEYYNNNISDFTNDSETRDIEYVTFTVVPSSEDDINVRNELTELSVRFKDSDNDESFSKRHSTDVATSFPYLSPANITDPKFLELISQEVSTVDGPYKLTNGRYRLSKLSEIVERADSVKASHILLTKENFTADSAKTILRDIKNQVKAGADFGQLAVQFSEGPSAIKGGDLGWFGEGSMVPEFNEVCFSSKKGNLKIVTTQFGVHLIQINDVSKLSSKYKIVFLDKEVVASSETKDAYYTQADNFINSVNKKSADTTFKAFAEINNQLVREDINIDNMKFNVSALENSREIIKWMYNENTNVADVSNSIYTCGNNYVVVCLSAIHEQGPKSLEEVRDFVSLLVTKDKQYDLISSKIQDSSLESVATSFGIDVKTVSAVNFANPNVNELGNEFAFVGVVNSTDIASTSSVFKGSNSAFIISVISKSENSITEANDSQKKEINTSNVNGVFYNAVMTLLKENANVVDSRIRFY
jgi:peptidyl-prolyl cis-trans isomerase D